MKEERLEYRVLDDTTLGVAVGLKLLLQYLEPWFRCKRMPPDVWPTSPNKYGSIGQQANMQGFVAILDDVARNLLGRVSAEHQAVLTDLWNFLDFPRTVEEIYNRIVEALDSIVGQDWPLVEAVNLPYRVRVSQVPYRKEEVSADVH